MTNDHISSDEKFGLVETFVAWDFVIGVAAAVGGVYVAYWHPETLDRLVVVLAALAPVIIGAAIAGVAIQAALMNDSFLHRVRKIPREPTYYLRHWILTVTLGVVGALATGVLAGLPTTAPTWLRLSAAGLACGFSGWMLGSVISAVISLKGFVLLRADGAEPEKVTTIGDGESDRRPA